jgi:hypothetical protein
MGPGFEIQQRQRADSSACAVWNHSLENISIYIIWTNSVEWYKYWASARNVNELYFLKF